MRQPIFVLVVFSSVWNIAQEDNNSQWQHLCDLVDILRWLRVVLMLACFYDPWSKQNKQNKQVCIWFFLPTGDTRARYLHGAKLWNGNLLWRKTSEQGQGLWHIRNTPQAKHMNFHWVILDLDARTVRVCMYKYIHNIIICIFVFRR